MRSIAAAFGESGPSPPDGDETSLPSTAPAPPPTAQAARQEAHVHQVRRDDAPLSEFGDTARAFYFAFPDLFPLGAGLPGGSFVPADDEHLMRQHDRRFSRHDEFVFYRFNMVGAVGIHSPRLGHTALLLVQAHPT